MTSPNIAIIVFVIITLIYFAVLVVYKGENNITPLIIYVIVTLLTQLTSNVFLTKQLCGEINGKTALIYTLLPWILIFGIFNLIILVFPGWLRPFSNTFGYFIISFMGLSSTIKNIIIQPADRNNPDVKLSKTLEEIYDNRSLLINEISNGPNGFEKFWEQLLADVTNKTNANKFKKDLENLVKLKFLISKFIWYLLVGILTTLTAYNFIIQTPCSVSVKEMEARHNDYERLVAENKENAVDNDRIYLNTGA